MPTLCIQRLTRKQSQISVFVAITSTSQWVPRANEPIYAATKAGLAHFAHSVSLDPKILQTLVVAPSGMDTKIQRDEGRPQQEGLLDPNWRSVG